MYLNRRFPTLASYQSTPFHTVAKQTTMDNNSSIDHKHRKFIERAIESEIVWGLASDVGYARLESREFEEAFVLPFWSDKAYAIAINIGDYEPQSMSLSDFLENFLIGSYNEGYLIGTNLDAEMNGKELEPLDLALQISSELLNQGKNISLKKYPSLEEFHQQVKNTVEAE